MAWFRATGSGHGRSALAASVAAVALAAAACPSWADPAEDGRLLLAQAETERETGATVDPELINVSPLLDPAPEVFDAKGRAVWDGRRTLRGVWVAHPMAQSARRVRIYNLTNGAVVDGALFKRDSTAGGSPVLISSDAAAKLGMSPDDEAQLRIVAVKPAKKPGREEVAADEPTEERSAATEETTPEPADSNPPAAADPTATDAAATDTAEAPADEPSPSEPTAETRPPQPAEKPAAIASPAVAAAPEDATGASETATPVSEPDDPPASEPAAEAAPQPTDDGTVVTAAVPAASTPDAETVAETETAAESIEETFHFEPATSGSQAAAALATSFFKRAPAEKRSDTSSNDAPAEAALADAAREYGSTGEASAAVAASDATDEGSVQAAADGQTDAETDAEAEAGTTDVAAKPPARDELIDFQPAPRPIPPTPRPAVAAAEAAATVRTDSETPEPPAASARADTEGAATAEPRPTFEDKTFRLEPLPTPRPAGKVEESPPPETPASDDQTFRFEPKTSRTPARPDADDRNAAVPTAEAQADQPTAETGRDPDQAPGAPAADVAAPPAGEPETEPEVVLAAAPPTAEDRTFELEPPAGDREVERPAPDTATSVPPIEVPAAAAPAAEGAPSPQPKDRTFKLAPDEAAPPKQIETAETRPASTDPLNLPYVQAGLFSVEENATNLVARLKVRGIAAITREVVSEGTTYSRVLAGPFKDAAARDAAQKVIRGMGLRDAIAVRG